MCITEKALYINQSAHQKLHSAETVLCKIYNDLVISTCQGQTFLLILLDLSAAFDTVDHGILIEELLQCGVLRFSIGLVLFRGLIPVRSYW